MNRTTKKLSVGAVTALVALATVAQGSAALAASAPSGAGAVSVRPAHPSAANPSYFTLQAAAGTTVRDAIVIANPSSTPVSLIVSPVDGLTGQTSGSVYANRQDKVYKAGAWVTPELSKLDLPAGMSRTVTFSVSVPAGTAAGDHLAGIAVENTQPTTSSNGFAVKEILRTVIGVEVTVPGAAVFVPRLTSLAIKGIGQTGIGAVNVGLENAGGRLAKPTLTVAIAGPGGYSKTIKRDLDTVLPGDPITYPFAWPDVLNKGDYTISATLVGGGKSATLSRSVHLGAQLAGVTHPLPVVITKHVKSGMPAWMWLAIILGAAIVFGFATGAVVRRGRPHALTSQRD